MFAKLTMAALVTFSATAQAGVIVGGSTLLDVAGLAQLENWGKQGPLTLTNIYTKSRGDTSYNFHFSVDNKGPTFTLMKASEDNGATWKTIGGYNPRSFKLSVTHYLPNPADWTAFVFNLSDSIIWRQSHASQTQNVPSWGPIFGDGDIAIADSMTLGSSGGISYGVGCHGPNGYNAKECRKSLVDGSQENGRNMLVGAFEVFSISPRPAAAIPEPGSLVLMSIGMLCLGAIRRKKRSRTA